MTKAELIDRLYQRMQEKHLDLPMDTVDDSVRTIIEVISEHLAQGHRAEFRGFGSFNIAIRPARIARNPRTGESVKVAEKRKVNFKAGLELRQLSLVKLNESI
jgi:integration host factor subunit beta